jgi:hypothetical protein
MDVLIGHVQQESDLADFGIPAVGDQETHLRIDVVGERLIHRLAAEGKFEAVKVKGAVKANVDQAGNAAFNVSGGRGLVHIDPRQQFRGKVRQDDGAPGRATCRG